MHLSGPLRGVVSKGSTASDSLSFKAGRADDLIAIAEVDHQGMVHWSSTSLVRVTALRADSITVRLTGFPEGRLAWTQLGS